jgi:hypothetical protein
MSLNQYYFTQRFEDSGTPITIDRNEIHNVLDNKIVLDTIPYEFARVKITSINGVNTKDMVEIPYYEDITDSSEFKVDYKVSGFVYFHPSREAQSIGVSYKGKGYVCIMPNRIATIISEDGKTILQTLDQLTTEAQTQANYAKQQGDLANTATQNANTATTNANNTTAQVLNETLIIKKPYVNTYNDIVTTYPSPQNGWETVAKDTNTRYRYNGSLTQWIPTDVAPYDKIGDLLQLTTTDKSNLVKAISENTNKIGNLTGLSTQNKTDLVGAINENVANLNDMTKKITVSSSSPLNPRINDIWIDTSVSLEVTCTTNPNTNTSEFNISFSKWVDSATVKLYALTSDRSNDVNSISGTLTRIDNKTFKFIATTALLNPQLAYYGRCKNIIGADGVNYGEILDFTITSYGIVNGDFESWDTTNLVPTGWTKTLSGSDTSACVIELNNSIKA